MIGRVRGLSWFVDPFETFPVDLGLCNSENVTGLSGRRSCINAACHRFSLSTHFKGLTVPKVLWLGQLHSFAGCNAKETRQGRESRSVTPSHYSHLHVFHIFLYLHLIRFSSGTHDGNMFTFLFLSWYLEVDWACALIHRQKRFWDSFSFSTCKMNPFCL